MYKCGWNGCEKAYGTLNHLNAHVTMQSHGQKRTPEGKLVNIIVSFVVLVCGVTVHARCCSPKFALHVFVCFIKRLRYSSLSHIMRGMIYVGVEARSDLDW